MDCDSSDEYVDDDDEVEEAVDLGFLSYRYEPHCRAVSQRLLMIVRNTCFQNVPSTQDAISSEQIPVEPKHVTTFAVNLSFLTENCEN